MSTIANVQPNPHTIVQAHPASPVDPPALVVYDGTTTLMFTPPAIVGGLQDAAAFARNLATAAIDWAQHCEKLYLAAQSSDPLGVDQFVGDMTERLGPRHGAG